MIFRNLAHSRMGRSLGLDQLHRANIPAALASLAVHLVIFSILMFATFAVTEKEESRPIEANQVVETALPEMERMDLEQLGQVSDPTSKPADVGSFAPQLSTAIVDAPERDPLTELAVLDIAQPAAMLLPEATRIDKNVAIRGAGAEYVGGVEGAVDRLAVEIHNRLKNGPTLVTWLFDASGSLNMERERLAEQIENVYKHVVQLDSDGLSSDDALLTMVIGFGEKMVPMTAEPVADPQEIASAIRQVQMDTSGIENTFQTIGLASQKFGRFAIEERRYQTMIIVVTDEVGDDESQLEEAIGIARRNRTPVYVFGSPALFGRTMGRMDYRNPETGDFYPGLEVRQGPESVMPEQIQIPFWYPRQNPGQPMSSGFGPYALSRMASQTGGIYFISRDIPGWRQFRGEHLREYRPELGTRAEYEKGLATWPVRRALVQASAATQRTIQSAPGLVFPPVESENFNREMLQQQSQAAQWAYVVDAAMGPMAKAAESRDREPSRRWRAHYDLMLGRLLALRVRCVEYNSACAKLRKDLPKFQNPESNAWRLEPSDQIVSGEKAETAAKEAKEYLERVIKDHPNTPWADLANRELSAPFGFRWVEYTLPLPPRAQPGNNNNNRPQPRNRPMPPPIKL
ncbi:MAG: hypothetical protein RJA81_1097 [Planctomycetota bacterium]